MITRRSRFFLPLVYLIIFGLGIWFYQTNAAVAQATNVMIHEAQIRTQQVIYKITGEKPKTAELSNDNSNNSKTTNSDGRWQTNSATVYIDLNNDVLRSATETAIQQWNQTGAFTFRTTTKRADAQIVVKAINEHNDGAAGLTNASVNTMTGYMQSATVELNAGYLLNPTYGYSQQRIVNTAEHELGHAIGLKHDNSQSVMQPAGSFYSIQPTDVQHVQQLYQEQNTNQSSN